MKGYHFVKFMGLWLLLLTFFIEIGATTAVASASYSSSVNPFYAISSLRYYLELKVTADSSLKASFFSAEDVEQLWERASTGSTCSAVIAAKELYLSSLQSDQSDSELASLQLSHMKQLLERAWQRLNPYWQEPSEVSAKGGGQIDYMLPAESPLWRILPAIFFDPSILDTVQSFAEAGFITVSQRPSGMCVAAHPRLDRYLVKAYIRSKKIKPNWEWLVHRCWGASNIRELIDEKKLRHFVVPDKWIYPLVATPIPAHPTRDELIAMQTPAALVVTDMELVGRIASRKAWKTRVTKRLIQELYCILSHGYSSCCLPSNIPFTRRGKFACIDTEHPQRPLPFQNVGRHLSPDMAEYFNSLVRSGGKGMPF
jgi:hypothetical protein